MSICPQNVASSEFNSGQLAQGSEVLSLVTGVIDFLNGANLDGSVNINVGTSYAWTARHAWTVSDASNDNRSLTVSAVMGASKYGDKVSSSAAQTTSSLVYHELSSGSSTVAVDEIVNAGTGPGHKVTNSGNAKGYLATLSSTSASANAYDVSNAGTGHCFGGSLRTLTGLNAPLTVKSLTSIITADNTATETEITGTTVTLPADFLKAGTTIRGEIWGQIDTPGAGVPSATIKVYYGGTAGTVLLNSGAVTHATSLADSLVKLEFLLTCISTGVTGTIEAQGKLTWGSNTAPTNRGMGTAATGATNDAVITIDTTASKDITTSFTWGSAVAGATFKARSGTMTIIR